MTRDKSPGRGALRVGGVVAAKEGFLREIEDLARGNPEGREGLSGRPAVNAVRERLGTAVRQVASVCAGAGLEPADLVPPTRRAYQLMSFLASGHRLEDHLRTLGLLQRADGRTQVRLDHTASLYRIERRAEGARLSASEGFVGAPESVLKALMLLAVPHARRRRPRKLVAAFAEGPDYASVLREVEASGGAYQSRPAGVFYNLLDLFDAVNQTYFGGRLDPPRLLWSERVPSIEFGHYEPPTDTIRLSRRLDSDDVPRFVLEHVMHHELLHRVLGPEPSGRKRFHSPRFRREEQRFVGCQEAEDVLKRLAREP